VGQAQPMGMYPVLPGRATMGAPVVRRAARRRRRHGSRARVEEESIAAKGMEGRGSGGGAKSVEAGCRSGEQGRCSSEGCGASANLPEAGAEELVQGSASAGVEEVRRRWACGWI